MSHASLLLKILQWNSHVLKISHTFLAVLQGPSSLAPFSLKLQVPLHPALPPCFHQHSKRREGQGFCGVLLSAVPPDLEPCLAHRRCRWIFDEGKTCSSWKKLLYPPDFHMTFSLSVAPSPYTLCLGKPACPLGLNSGLTCSGETLSCLG